MSKCDNKYGNGYLNNQRQRIFCMKNNDLEKEEIEMQNIKRHMHVIAKLSKELVIMFK